MKTETIEDILISASIYDIAYIVKKFYEEQRKHDIEYCSLEDIARYKDENMFYLTSIELAKWSDISE